MSRIKNKKSYGELSKQYAYAWNWTVDASPVTYDTWYAESLGPVKGGKSLRPGKGPSLVYALLAPTFFEMDNAFGEENCVDDIDNEKMTSYSQQVEVMETECKSPCPSSAEMCIAMCA